MCFVGCYPFHKTRSVEVFVGLFSLGEYTAGKTTINEEKERRIFHNEVAVEEHVKNARRQFCRLS